MVASGSFAQGTTVTSLAVPSDRVPVPVPPFPLPLPFRCRCRSRRAGARPTSCTITVLPVVTSAAVAAAC